jgi:hypothetical protein
MNDKTNNNNRRFNRFISFLLDYVENRNEQRRKGKELKIRIKKKKLLDNKV